MQDAQLLISETMYCLSCQDISKYLTPFEYMYSTTYKMNVLAEDFKDILTGIYRDLNTAVNKYKNNSKITYFSYTQGILDSMLSAYND